MSTEPTELTDAEIREMVSGAEYGNEDYRQTIALGNALLAAREQLAQAEARFAAGDEHFPWSATEFGTLCCCGEAMDAQERCLSNKGLQQRAEAAEADCAALQRKLGHAESFLGSIAMHTCESHCGCQTLANDYILASPNPGAGLLADREQDRKRIAELEAQKNGAYQERDRLVAALSKMFPATLGRHVGADWEDDWRNIVFIDLPTGQASWHIHDSELPLFVHLSQSTPKWDGHTTEEKYARLAALGAKP